MNRTGRKVAWGFAGAVVMAALGVGTALPEPQESGKGRGGMDADSMSMDSTDMAGMDMGGTSTDGTIRVAAADLATFGVTFGTAAMRPLVKGVRSVGLVDFDETRTAYVAPKFGGWVERLHVDFTGQVVRRGEPLFDVYSPELVTAQEELLLAARMAGAVGESEIENVADGARDLLASARRRLEYWDVPDEQIERLLRTGEVRKTLTLHAPASGVVMEKNVIEGQAFRPGDNLYMIADLSRVWVNAEVFEADAGLLREGMPARVTVAALPGATFEGTVEYVYPTLEDRTRSMRARISLANPGARLKPGMYATVRLSSAQGSVLTVPASAVLYTGERAVAFVDMGGGTLMPHELRLGQRGDSLVQVLTGLVAGQRIVTSAQFLLDSESNLAEVMKAMMAQMNMSDMSGMDMDMDMGGADTTGGMDMGRGGASRPDSTGGR